MNLQNGPISNDLELKFYDAQPEPDLRRDPNYILYLFLVIVGLFVAAMATIFLTNGQLPFVD